MQSYTQSLRLTRMRFARWRILQRLPTMIHETPDKYCLAPSLLVYSITLLKLPRKFTYVQAVCRSTDGTWCAQTRSIVSAGISQSQDDSHVTFRCWCMRFSLVCLILIINIVEFVINSWFFWESREIIS